MKNNWWLYILILSGAIFLWFFTKAPVNWLETYAPNDDNPFGLKALHELLPTYFEQEEMPLLYNSFSELVAAKDSGNVISISITYSADEREAEALLEYVSQGNTVLLSANYFSAYLSDTLRFATKRNPNIYESAIGPPPEINIDFKRGNGYPKRTFTFAGEVVPAFFNSLPEQAEALAYTFDEEAVFAQWEIGKGTLLLNTTPKIFTNYYLLKNQGENFAAGLLSPLANGKPVKQNMFYQYGRVEAKTPLRYILSQPALRAAYMVALAGILLFIIFYGKRTQRVIPVLKPLANTSLEFAKTLGQLYYEQKDHANLANKRLRYWINHLSTRYFLHQLSNENSFAEELSAKSGVALKVVKELLYFANSMGNNKQWSSSELLHLENLLQKFYHHSKTKQHGGNQS